MNAASFGVRPSTMILRHMCDQRRTAHTRGWIRVKVRESLRILHTKYVAVGLFRQRLFQISPKTPVVLQKGRTDKVRNRAVEKKCSRKI